MRASILMLFIAISGTAHAGCFDGLTTSNTVISKVRGLYVHPDHYGEDQLHYVILDKASCSASKSGDVTLASTTKNHYYLSFKSSDEFLYSAILSAQATGTTLEFRMGQKAQGDNANSIAYIISPSGARSQ